MLERVIQPLVYTRTALRLYFVTGVLLQSAGWLQRGMWTATLRVAGGQKIGASCYFKSTLQRPHINRNKNCAEKKKTLSELIWRSIKSMKKKEKKLQMWNLLFKWPIIQAGLGGPAAEKVSLIRAAWLWMLPGDIAELQIICGRPEPFCFDSLNKLTSAPCPPTNPYSARRRRGS